MLELDYLEGLTKLVAGLFKERYRHLLFSATGVYLDILPLFHTSYGLMHDYYSKDTRSMYKTRQSNEEE